MTKQAFARSRPRDTLCHRSRLTAGLVLVCLTLAAAAPTLADTQVTDIIGRIDATAYGEVPAGAAIWVRPEGAATLTREVAQRIADALAARGHRMQERAGHYVLLVRLASSLDFEPQEEPWLRFENNAVMLRPRLGREEPKRVHVGPRIILVHLEDGEGNLVWSARAGLVGDAAHSESLIRRLLPALIEQMFATVYGRAVR